MKVNFQTIFLAIFLAFFVFAVLIFSGILPIGKSKNSGSAPQGKITIWGTFPSLELSKVFDSINNANRDLIIVYTQKPQSTYQQALIEAFATGTGPDMFFISEDMILKNKPFIYTLPYASYQEKVFRDTFIDGAEIYLDNDGVIGLPIVIDPLVMYYNKTLLANAGVALPPEYWDEIFPLVDKFTKKKTDGTISESTIALGTFDNITHAKDILSLLLMQGGNPIMVRNGSAVNSTLKERFSLPVSPIESVLAFYNSFSNASDRAYSWNRGLLPSYDMFTGGKLAFYLGRASELFKIEAINPNLSFDVTNVPQTRGTSTIRTYGKIYGLVINKKSPNTASAFGVLGLMTTDENLQNIATALSLPPSSRLLLAKLPNDPYLYSFFKSAIVVRSWLDPESSATDKIFSNLISNVLSNKLKLSDAVSKADDEIKALLPSNL
jgi:ABC-type glycerol-3-phosphate transport system substrate-binding protein